MPPDKAATCRMAGRNDPLPKTAGEIHHPIEGSGEAQTGLVHQAGLVRIVGQALLVGPQLFQQLPDGWIGELLVGQSPQCGQLTRAG